ncbi:uncharacterized protein with FMN-binding domain [Marmoricola sp. URHA0025 HA25]
MRRIVMWVMSTVTVVVLLFGYHTSTSGPTSAAPTVISSGTSGTPQTAGTSGTSSTSAASTVSGGSVETRWGPVEVQITVASGKITQVDVPVYPDNNGKDQEINAYALPRLVQETLDAQSASIDMVSGATVTSDGYLQSLQAALDKAGL